MTCRHSSGDTSCSSHPSNVAYREAEYAAERSRKAEAAAKRKKSDAEGVTPDAERYTIENVVRVGPHLVMKLKYPNCAKCAFEGNKVMVFFDVPEMQVLRWRKVDPHFRAFYLNGPEEAPSPAARFPASDEGWKDAVAYANSKVKVKAVR